MTFFETLNDLVARGRPVVSVTVVDSVGSVPQDRGAKMIVTEEGLHSGTVGGGKVETKAIAEALLMISGRTENTKFTQWNLNKDVGMTCGGTIRLFFESFNVSHWHVVVFGAGHVAQALVSLLAHLDCRITCIDPRAEWLARIVEAPNVTKLQSSDMPSEAGKIPESAFVVLMTMGHTTDKPILLEILRTRSFPYLGVIGSHAKAKQLRKDVVEAGLPDEKQKEFCCPIGLEIGSNHPYEIAVSVAAQLIGIRDRIREADRVADAAFSRHD